MSGGHTFIFPSRRNAGRFVSWIEMLGYACTAEQVDYEWKVVCTGARRLSSDQFADAGDRLEELAKQMGGRRHGWPG
ncbi:MAG: ribonuclease E inhibitor RraB [Pseudomonadota bacterium]